MNNWRFKLLYDGECPFCMREVRWLQRRNRHGHLAFEDISSPTFDPSSLGVNREELLGVIHGVLPDGRLVKKVEVFRQAYRAVGLGWLVAPTGWPGLRWLFDCLYSLFARHRVRLGRLFGRTCNSCGCKISENKDRHSSTFDVDQIAEVHRNIEMVLLRDWDPIGVAEVPEAKDEYRAYSRSVYDVAVHTRSARAIADHLLRLEQECMGLSSRSADALLPVAQTILRLVADAGTKSESK